MKENKPSIKKQDLADMLDLVWRQLNEDRGNITKVFSDLKSITIESQDYAVNGMTLAKFAEIMSKQTSQVIDLLKLFHKDSKENDKGLSEDELNHIYLELHDTKKENKEK